MPKKIIQTQAKKTTPVVQKTAPKVVAKQEPTPQPIKVEEVAPKVETPPQEEIDVISNEISQIYADLAQIATLTRNVTQRVKCLEREVKKEKRTLIKLQAKNSKRSTNSTPRGFAKPTRISDTMAKFFNVPIGTEMARTEAANLIIKYIQEKELAKIDNKKAFKPDKALQSILSPLEDKHKKEDGYTYFNLQHYIKNNFASASNAAAKSI